MNRYSLDHIDCAVRALHVAGCRRVDGVWVTSGGAELAADPLEAFQQLKRSQLRTAVETSIRANGGRFNREYVPSGTR